MKKLKVSEGLIKTTATAELGWKVQCKCHGEKDRNWFLYVDSVKAMLTMNKNRIAIWLVVFGSYMETWNILGSVYAHLNGRICSQTSGNPRSLGSCAQKGFCKATAATLWGWDHEPIGTRRCRNRCGSAMSESCAVQQCESVMNFQRCMTCDKCDTCGLMTYKHGWDMDRCIDICMKIRINVQHCCRSLQVVAASMAFWWMPRGSVCHD